MTYLLLYVIGWLAYVMFSLGDEESWNEFDNMFGRKWSGIVVTFLAFFLWPLELLSVIWQVVKR